MDGRTVEVVDRAAERKVLDGLFVRVLRESRSTRRVSAPWTAAGLPEQ
ncbi:hypothetical protein [Streptomyces kebangsaanensis]|nr:hypothetical protein [Streptomyces kebangsaanensis]